MASADMGMRVMRLFYRNDNGDGVDTSTERTSSMGSQRQTIDCAYITNINSNMGTFSSTRVQRLKT